MKKNVIDCPLCESNSTHLYSQDKQRSYYQCSSCELVFVSRLDIIEPDLEKKRYETHQNHAGDSRYLTYLSNIFEECAPYLKKGECGLDFGCGESKLLGQLFTEAGFPTESFDLYFHPDQAIWTRQFHFVVMSEVIEHLREPRESMTQIFKLLAQSGQIFVKTKLLPETTEEFDRWFYKRDPTHVQFFNQASLNYLKKNLGFKSMESIGNDLYLFK